MPGMKRSSKPSVIVDRPVFVILLTTFLFTAGCQEVYTPKPKSYFRIDFPEKKYISYQSECNYKFDYPVYAVISPYQGPDAEPCWINLVFPGYKGIIHLTYKTLHNDLASHTEDIRLLAYKHIVKADDILEKTVSYPERNVYGLIYDIRGNTASSLSFYLTDSTRNFLSGSLYFSVKPNKDSLAPVIRFFSEDIDHLIQTLTWSK
jgi:gliding motility-associated lipoprotein GldD